MNPAQYAVICGVGGMISQIGDLAASAIKRNHDIKDYGHLIPIIYYLATFLAGRL